MIYETTEWRTDEVIGKPALLAVGDMRYAKFRTCWDIFRREQPQSVYR